jgi:hypothetical protein
LLTTTAILSAFSSLTGDISLISEKDLHWFGHVDLVIVAGLVKESEWLARWSLVTILRHGSYYTLPPDFSTSTTGLHCGKCPRCK